MRARKFGGFDTLIVRGVEFAVTDIVHYRAREQIGILQNDTERTTQVSFLYLIDVDTVVSDFAVFDVVETVYKVGDCGFARARRTDKRYLLTGFGVNADVVQNEFFGNVTEVHIEKSDVAFEFGIGDCAVRFVRVTPCPFARALIAFGDVAVFVDFGVYEFDISVVGFGFVGEEFEYTSRACDCHDNGVNLQGNLTDVERELSAHVEEGNYCTHCDNACFQSRDRQVSDAAENERAAHDCNRYEHDVSDVGNCGHEHIAVTVCLVGVTEKLVVDFCKIAFCRLFVTENLDDFLSVYHFLGKTFRLTYRVLLTHKEFCTSAAYHFGYPQHKRYADEHNQCKVNA